MIPNWEHFWYVVNAEFMQLAEEVLHTHPSLWWTCGHAENEAFPFWAYASFGGSGVPGEEDVVVSITFKNDMERLVFSCDVALADGQIVTDGPTESEPINTDRVVWIEELAISTALFIRSQVGTLRGLL